MDASAGACLAAAAYCSHLPRSTRPHASLGAQRLLNAATLEGAPLHRSALAWRAIVRFERCRGPRGMAAGAAMRAMQFVPWSKVGPMLVVFGLAGWCCVDLGLCSISAASKARGPAQVGAGWAAADLQRLQRGGASCTVLIDPCGVLGICSYSMQGRLWPA